MRFPHPGRAAGPRVRRHAHWVLACRTRVALAAGAVMILAAGCGGGSGAPGRVADTVPSTGPGTSAPVATPTPAPTPAAGTGTGSAEPGLPPGSSMVATAKGATVAVHHTPGGRVDRGMANPTGDGAPLTFLVLDRRPGWLHVRLPARPNGSTGWVGAGDVTVTLTPYRLIVHRGTHLLELLRDGRRTATYPVGVGTSVTPTPAGGYFLTELISPPDPSGPYGPYAFGLSAFSDVLKTFAGGPGQLGLHGTDDPGGVGKDVSHGCLRVSNAVITTLAKELPLGTPIDIEK